MTPQINQKYIFGLSDYYIHDRHGNDNFRK